MFNQRNRPRRFKQRTAALTLCVPLLIAGLSACEDKDFLFADEDSSVEGTAPHRSDAIQASLDQLVHNDGYPGALAAVQGRDGQVRDYIAGVGDVATGQPVPVNGQVRIASNTKTFVATVVLQLVGEGKVELDAPVETYLPNLLRGDGIDGRKITVRQILQHTSGLDDNDAELATNYADVQHTFFEPRQLLDIALAKKALFAPGTGWSYSNPNYIVAGLLIQQVTGRPVGEEITRRIIDRIGLRETYWPPAGEQTMRGKHPHGYFPDTNGNQLDVTEMDPSMGWAAGQLIGTPRDLNRFLTALLDGELLEPEQLEQMQTIVDAPEFDTTGNARYGLGIATFELSCGGTAWTHGGDAPGYTSRNAATEDGRAATVVVTGAPTSLPAAQHVEQALDTALCAQP
ncbi:D-alanyl-D-alanine carboxypeptidase [Saccharopolyspora antimicrobica]|uniref:D-alanyl-D-alanine carboxypeptidase n=1 Tax=Saccharopolyspora antimicrobica TaxID=455193 RepID=A0A1I5B7K8_9PSEU|nr:serine hydrolase domain-containing protein [Saccharopolyspora antimicrobica]RKT86495.1 D-alanyl-D-alanine carboxypeptidase [Saccharopolyspora antimicrobica]SFN70708.1 D-alanyl-D-alanine carboxypeptidase [Saccharopolyspora antimicrobica]